MVAAATVPCSNDDSGDNFNNNNKHDDDSDNEDSGDDDSDDDESKPTTTSTTTTSRMTRIHPEISTTKRKLYAMEDIHNDDDETVATTRLRPVEEHTGYSYVR